MRTSVLGLLLACCIGTLIRQGQNIRGVDFLLSFTIGLLSGLLLVELKKRWPSAHQPAENSQDR